MILSLDLDRSRPLLIFRAINVPLADRASHPVEQQLMPADGRLQLAAH
jgi:hypothetical protein